MSRTRRIKFEHAGIATERRPVSELSHRPRTAGTDSCPSQPVAAVTRGGRRGHARARRTRDSCSCRDSRRPWHCRRRKATTPMFLGSKDWLAINLSRGCRLSPCKGRRDNRCDRRPVAEISLKFHHLPLSVKRTTWRDSMRKTQPKSGRLRIRYERRADIRASGPAT
jgi:hypothetical protein